MNTCRCEADERYRFEGERESSQTIKSPQVIRDVQQEKGSFTLQVSVIPCSAMVGWWRCSLGQIGVGKW
jgi:hypothetical protein